jgi:hypothetical protein
LPPNPQTWKLLVMTGEHREIEKTYIWTHNRDLIQTGHLQDLGYREPVLVPGGCQ